MHIKGTDMKKHRLLKRILFLVEIVAVVAVMGGLYVYGQLADQLQTIKKAPEVTLNDDGEITKGVIKTNEDVSELTGFTTYALFGIDQRDKNEALSGQNSDTMIICSVNNDTHEIRMVSLYRDTLLNIGDDIYAKANAAYAYGGPEQAITMLNTNFDLDIKDYVTVDFNALTEAVDAVGGLDVPLSYAEIVHMNNYCVETSEETDKDYDPVELPEETPENQEEILDTYHLNGVQVTSYCRIRYTSSLDMGRTERQRYTIQSVFNKAVVGGLPVIMDLMNKILPMVSTSLNETEILKLLPVLIDYDFCQSTGFPTNYRFSNVRGSIIVPIDLCDNVICLHHFLYDDEGYEPSSRVKEINDKILEIVGGAENTQAEAPAVTYQQGDAEDIFIWQDNGEGGNIYEDYGYIYAPETPAPDEAEGGLIPLDDGGDASQVVPDGTAEAPGTDTGDGAAVVPGTDTGDGTAVVPGTDTGDGTAEVPGSDTGGQEIYVDPGTDTGGGESYDNGGGGESYDYGGGGESYDNGGGGESYDYGGDAGVDPGISYLETDLQYAGE